VDPQQEPGDTPVSTNYEVRDLPLGPEVELLLQGRGVRKRKRGRRTWLGDKPAVSPGLRARLLAAALRAATALLV
jgi:hypothetical protein